jgi:hypothetical protein
VRTYEFFALAICCATLVACDPGPGGGSLIPVPPPAPLSVAPSNVQLNGTGAANALSISIQEPGYAGTFGEKDTCGNVAAVVTANPAGPAATYTVTGVAAGSCIATFTDSVGQSKSVPITVTTSGFNVQ